MKQRKAENWVLRLLIFREGSGRRELDPLTQQRMGGRPSSRLTQGQGQREKLEA